MFFDQEDAKISYDAVDFDAKTNGGCTTVVLESDPAILEVDDAFNRPLPAELRDIPLITGAPSGKEWTVLKMAQFAANGHEVGLRYKRRSLLEYVGLSERSIAMSFDFPVYTGPTPQQAGGHVSVTPPSGFRVVESSLPGTPGLSDSDWEVDIPKTLRGAPPLRLKMRDERRSRLDHILDSSIAVLLGIGVGGMANAYLALILLKRSHRHRPS